MYNDRTVTRGRSLATLYNSAPSNPLVHKRAISPLPKQPLSPTQKRLRGINNKDNKVNIDKKYVEDPPLYGPWYSGYNNNASNMVYSQIKEVFFSAFNRVLDMV